MRVEKKVLALRISLGLGKSPERETLLKGFFLSRAIVVYARSKAGLDYAL